MRRLLDGLTLPQRKKERRRRRSRQRAKASGAGVAIATTSDSLDVDTIVSPEERASSARRRKTEPNLLAAAGAAPAKHRSKTSAAKQMSAVSTSPPRIGMSDVPRFRSNSPPHGSSRCDARAFLRFVSTDASLSAPISVCSTLRPILARR